MKRMFQVSAALLFAIAIARPASTQVKPNGKSLGIDVSGMDRSVRPQDDFFRFVDGAWNDNTAIPDFIALSSKRRRGQVRRRSSSHVTIVRPSPHWRGRGVTP